MVLIAFRVHNISLQNERMRVQCETLAKDLEEMKASLKDFQEIDNTKVTMNTVFENQCIPFLVQADYFDLSHSVLCIYYRWMSSWPIMPVHLKFSICTFIIRF